MTLDDVANMLERYRPMAMYFTKNKALADDVLQEVFIKINKRYDILMNPIRFFQITELYLFTIVD